MKSILITIIIFAYSLFAQDDSLYLRLPEYIYTTTTSNFSVYYNNVILTQTPEAYSYAVDCPVGFADSMKYNLDSLNAGNYNLQMKELIHGIL